MLRKFTQRTSSASRTEIQNIYDNSERTGYENHFSLQSKSLQNKI